MTTPRPTRVCMRVNNVFTHDLRVRREAEALAAAGFDVTVIADMKPDMGLAENEVVDGVRIRRIAKSSRIPYWSIIKPLLDADADVYHGHDIDSLLPVVAAKILRGRGTRAVYDSHELWSGHARDKVHRKRRMLVRIEGLLLRGADALITASPAYTEAIVERYGFKRPAQTILNVPRWFSEAELSESWATRDADAEVRVVYVSVFQKGRGAIPLIEAFHYLPDDFVLELVGPIPQPEYEDLMRSAAASLGERIRFVGVLPPAELVPRLARGHVSAVPIEPLSLSYRLTAPNKLFDSMMAGTPVVASDMPVIASIVRESGVGVVCDVADPADVARAILAAHAEQDSFRANCRIAAERYNWDIERASLVGLYEQLTSA